MFISYFIYPSLPAIMKCKKLLNIPRAHQSGYQTFWPKNIVIINLFSERIHKKLRNMVLDDETFSWGTKFPSGVKRALIINATWKAFEIKQNHAGAHYLTHDFIKWLSIEMTQKFHPHSQRSEKLLCLSTDPSKFLRAPYLNRYRNFLYIRRTNIHEGLSRKSRKNTCDQL